MTELSSEPKTFMDKVEGRQSLLDVCGVLGSLKARYFLILGTALGAYRDKGFTPTEQDIDLGFLQEDFALIAGDIANSLIKSGFEISSINRPFSRCRAIVARRNDIKIDMVGYILWKNFRFCPNSDPKTHAYAIVHERKILENYEPVKLFGVTFSVPSPIERYLELEYGEDWRTPKEDHVSRTRQYDFLEQWKIPNDLLDS